MHHLQSLRQKHSPNGTSPGGKNYTLTTFVEQWDWFCWSFQDEGKSKRQGFRQDLHMFIPMLHHESSALRNSLIALKRSLHCLFKTVRVPETIFSDNNFHWSAQWSAEVERNFSRGRSRVISSICYCTWHELGYVTTQSTQLRRSLGTGVESAKHHLRRIMGNAILTMEEFTTLLTQIEAILNARPMSPMSSNPNDDAPQSPGRFLIGSQLTALPENSSLKEISSAKRFELVKTISEHFWKRWQKEYLSNLQPLSKWQEAVDAPQPWDVVYIMEDNVPTLHWLRARIEEMFYGNDKIARVAKVFNGKSSFIRPLSKLRALPGQIHETQLTNDGNCSRPNPLA